MKVESTRGTWEIGHFRKSSRSNGGGAQNCVEAAHFSNSVVSVRDSKNIEDDDFPLLSVAASDWKTIVNHLKINGKNGV